MSPPARVAILDAFTSRAYKGNPAAVVLSTVPFGARDRENLAKELNQPAIAFVSHPAIDSPEAFTAALASPSSPAPLIRWHTATGKSLPLCGHATMAASAYLLDYFAPQLDEIRYEFVRTTTHETLVATRCRDDGRIEIALPASHRGETVNLDDERSHAIFDALEAATRLERRDVEKLDLSPSNEAGSENLTVQLARHVDLAALEVDALKFLDVPYRGIYLTNLAPPPPPLVVDGESTARRTPHYRCRVFFPRVGILEDHVCGSANTRLGPLWIEQQAQRGTPLPDVVEVDQVSPRGGQFALRWDGKWGDQGGIVALRGNAKRAR
ncbi:hypothetical protein JCM3766R1_004036 [Sporobolomyces carnicolor]